MKIGSLLVALFFVIAGMSTELDLGGLVYRVQRVGGKYFVYQPNFLLTTHDISALSKTDCALLTTEIERKEKSYYICDENPDSPTCQILKTDAIFRSKEENFQRPIIPHPTDRIWRLEPKYENTDETILKGRVASQLGIHEDDVVVKLNTETTIVQFPVLKFSEASLLSKVTKIVPLASGFLEPLRMVSGKLVANNRFLACDLESGNLNFNGKATLQLSYTESISEADMDAIWNIYSELRAFVESDAFKNMPNLMQAAHIGKQLALSIRKNRLHEAYSFEDLVDDLFSFDEWKIILKRYYSKETLREQHYPVQTFSTDVEVAWSLR